MRLRCWSTPPMPPFASEGLISTAAELFWRLYCEVHHHSHCMQLSVQELAWKECCDNAFIFSGPYNHGRRWDSQSCISWAPLPPPPTPRIRLRVQREAITRSSSHVVLVPNNELRIFSLRLCKYSSASRLAQLHFHIFSLALLSVRDNAKTTDQLKIQMEQRIPPPESDNSPSLRVLQPCATKTTDHQLTKKKKQSYNGTCQNWVALMYISPQQKESSSKTRNCS